MTRRNFMMLGGAAFAAAALADCGQEKAPADLSSDVFPEPSFKGDKNMDKKILVAYASKAGSTAEVAVECGRILNERGADVDVRRIDHIKDLEIYRAVVIGSAVRIGHWLPQAEKYIKIHQEVLSRRPVAIFTVCMTLKDDTPQNRKKVEEFVAPVHKIIKPDEEAFFAGKVDYKKLPFLTGLMAKMAKAPEGDFRDWGKIRQWASSIFSGLLPAATKLDKNGR